MRYLLVVILSGFFLGATASQVNTYINGNVLTADQLNSEFSNIYSTVNSIDDANISDSAAIDPAKLSTSIEGDGLARQVDGSLDVNVDGSTVKIVANVVKIEDLPGSAIVAGGVGTTQLADFSITKQKAAVKSAVITAVAGNVGVSNGTGAVEVEFLTGSSGDLSNNLVNLTTLGGPVMISIIPATDATESYIECEDATTDPCILEIARDGATVIKVPFFTQGGQYRLPPGAFTALDVPAAGTYEYKVKYAVPSATALRVLNVRLMAYEL